MSSKIVDPPDSRPEEAAAESASPDTLVFSWRPHSPEDEPTITSTPIDADGHLGDVPIPSSLPPIPASAPESDVVHSSGSLHTIRTAAAHLGVNPDTLRAQCRNAARENGIARLGEGMIAFKVGKHWRVRFPWWR